MDEYYSDELKQKILRGNKVALQKGQSTDHPHVGFTVNEDKHYEVDPVTSPIIKEMFHRYAYINYSILDCIDYLNKEGVKNRKGNPFKRHSVWSILSNPFYNGRYIVAGTDYGNVIPKLIDDETFEAVQKRLVLNKNMPASSANKHTVLYYLSSKLYCECGCPMCGVSGHSHTGQTYRYYRCPNAKGKNKTCKCKPIPKEMLEDAVEKYATSLFTDEFIHDIAHRVAMLSAANPGSMEIASLRKSLQKNKKAISNLLDAIENGGDIELISPRIAQRKAENEQFENRIRELSLNSEVLKEEDIVAFLSQFKDYKSVNENMRALVLNVLISRIIVFYDGKQLRMSIVYNCSNSVDINKHEKSEPSSFYQGSPYSYNGGADGSRTRVQE